MVFRLKPYSCANRPNAMAYEMVYSEYLLFIPRLSVAPVAQLVTS